MTNRTLAAVIGICLASPTAAADLTVTFANGSHGATLPVRNASCIAASGKAAAGENRSPALSWSRGPEATRSYALTMIDPDVPADLTLLNRGRHHDSA